MRGGWGEESKGWYEETKEILNFLKNGIQCNRIRLPTLIGPLALEEI